MTATAVGFFGEPFFFGIGTAAPVILFGCGGFLSRGRINIEGTEFLATFPAPRAATAGAHDEASCCIEATGENIVTGSVFQGPAFTPGALFCIGGHSLLLWAYFCLDETLKKPSVIIGYFDKRGHDASCTGSCQILPPLIQGFLDKESPNRLKVLFDTHIVA
jgi:hypothetical protein